MTRYEYFRRSTREKAELELEDSLAHGDVSVGERPRIEPVYSGGTRHGDPRRVVAWACTLEG
jgi:hypothetical protein